MASLQNAPGKKRWLPLAIAAVIAGVVVYSVMDSSDNSSSPAPQTTSDTTDLQNLQLANRHVRNGRYQDAITAVDQVLAADPQNMDAQLLKASLLVKTGMTGQAEVLLNELREEYPDRPEPLNNLAVIYAEAGDSGRAIQTLQNAFKTHPSYAQVYQNLGDMYAALAAEAYNKALGVSSSDSGPQLAALHQFGYPTELGMKAKLFDVTPEQHAHEETPAPITVSVVAETPDSTPTEPTYNDVVTVEESPEKGVIENVSTDVTREDMSIAAAIGVSEVAPEKPLPYTNIVMNQADSEAISAAQTTASNQSIDNTVLSASPEEIAIARETERAAKLLASLEVEQTTDEARPVVQKAAAPEKTIEIHLKNWAKAWSQQNVQAYVRAYVAGYQPSDGITHKQWVQSRTNRLSKPDFIKVALSNIQVVMLSDSRAEVTFRQSYRSDRYRDVEQKRISLMRRSSGWKIVQEGKF